MLEIITELIEAEVARKVNSKIDGNRNWLIHTEIVNGQLRISYAGRPGAGSAYQVCSLAEMAKYHYRWYYFTYKKDYKEAYDTLIASGAVYCGW